MINFVSTKYNWDSYSIIRGVYELYPGLKWGQLSDPGETWIFSSSINPEKRVKKMFGLSDPNMFDPERVKWAKEYYTNDYNLACKHGFKWFPACCDVRYHKKQYIKKKYKVTFIGTGQHPYIPHRIEWITKLREMGFKINVFGGGWPEHPDNNSPVVGEEMIKVINQSELCLDLGTETSSLARRIFECGACGTPIATPRRLDTELMFENDEVIFYENFDDLASKIRGYMIKFDRLPLIGEKARLKCINEHDIKHRLKLI